MASHFRSSSTNSKNDQDTIRNARIRNQLQFEYSTTNTNLKDAQSERKKADWDAQLLLNRISLLEQEKHKFQKKITETQKKTEDIWNIKRRNFEHRREKQERIRQQKEDVIQKMHQNMKTKETIRNNIYQQRVNQVKQVHEEANTIKKTLHDFCQINQYMKEDEIQKKMSNAQRVKDMEKYVEEKNRWIWKQKLLKNKDNYEDRLEQEAVQIKQREKDIKNLEKKEFELLQVLQQSQDMQQQAYNKLKQVASLNMRVTDIEGMNTGQFSSTKKSNYNSTQRSSSVKKNYY